MFGLKVTYSWPKVTHNYPKVNYSDPRMTFSYPKVTYSDPKVTQSDPTHLPLPLSSPPEPHLAISWVKLNVRVVVVGGNQL